jgi:hypothetical protein
MTTLPHRPALPPAGDLTGRTAVVTGAADGIRHATAAPWTEAERSRGAPHTPTSTLRGKRGKRCRAPVGGESTADIRLRAGAPRVSVA